MSRVEAGGPLAPHLRAIGKDECIYDDSDVYAVLQAAARIEELEAEAKRLRDGIDAHRLNHANPFPSWTHDEANERLWSLLDAR